MTYFLLKFIHITAAIVWIGGVFTLSTLTMLLARKKDRAGLTILANHSEFFGKAIIGPSAAITLIAGIVMVAVFELGMSFWIMWGFTVMLVSMALGSTFIRRTGTKLGEVAASPDSSDSQLQTVQRRLTILSSINLLLLLSAVWAMVFKPAL